MFELSDFGKVKPDHKPIVSITKNDSQPIIGYGAADEAEYSYDKSKFEDGEILSYFKSRRISRKWVQYWMILQGVLLFLQMYLFKEVTLHASTYNSVVHASCKEGEAGTCKSRLWQVRHTRSYPIDKIAFDAPIHFTFTAAAWAPYDLQVSVLTDPNEMRIPYELSLKRLAAGTEPEQTFHEYRTTGVSAIEVHQTNTTSFTAKDLFKGSLPKAAQWEGTLTLGQHANMDHPSYRHGSAIAKRIQDKLKNVEITVNEMVRLEMSIFKREAPMCELESTWSNVMMKSMSIGSGRLDWISNMLGWSILCSVAVTVLVWAWYSGRRIGDGLSSLKFHYLVAAKTLVQDVPLQALVLCTFLLVLGVLSSALSNQFLFSADPTQIRNEDDVGFVYFVRFMLGCVMILPFSTAMVAFNGSLVQMPGLFHTVFLIPCFAGWVGFFSLLCFPIATLVDDDDLLTY